MSAAKHTPGPWRVDDHPRREYPRVTDARGRFIADCDTDADAHLIAAAPELLQELKHAAELLVSLSTECRTACLDGELVDTLAAAERFDNLIAKATGGG